MQGVSECGLQEGLYDSVNMDSENFEPVKVGLCELGSYRPIELPVSISPVSSDTRTALMRTQDAVSRFETMMGRSRHFLRLWESRTKPLAIVELGYSNRGDPTKKLKAYCQRMPTINEETNEETTSQAAMESPHHSTAETNVAHLMIQKVGMTVQEPMQAASCDRNFSGMDMETIELHDTFQDWGAGVPLHRVQSSVVLTDTKFACELPSPNLSGAVMAYPKLHENKTSPMPTGSVELILSQNATGIWRTEPISPASATPLSRLVKRQFRASPGLPVPASATSSSGDFMTLTEPASRSISLTIVDTNPQTMSLSGIPAIELPVDAGSSTICPAKNLPHPFSSCPEQFSFPPLPRSRVHRPYITSFLNPGYQTAEERQELRELMRPHLRGAHQYGASQRPNIYRNSHEQFIVERIKARLNLLRKIAIEYIKREGWELGRTTEVMRELVEKEEVITIDQISKLRVELESGGKMEYRTSGGENDGVEYEKGHRKDEGSDSCEEQIGDSKEESDVSQDEESQPWENMELPVESVGAGFGLDVLNEPMMFSQDREGLTLDFEKMVENLLMGEED